VRGVAEAGEVGVVLFAGDHVHDAADLFGVEAVLLGDPFHREADLA
jgi:hypothetical protein